MPIHYALDPDLTVDEFVDILRRSTLAERRPVGDSAAMAGMLEHADLILTARTDDGKLVGIARSVTDFHYCTYLSELAVDESYQNQGIGKQLIRRTHEAAGLDSNLILLSAPAAADYYPHIGMSPHKSSWVFWGEHCKANR